MSSRVSQKKGMRLLGHNRTGFRGGRKLVSEAVDWGKGGGYLLWMMDDEMVD